MDMKNGQGTYTYENGTKYEGSWKDGKEHGEGIFTDQKGKSKRGIWDNGERERWIDQDQESKLSTKS